MDFGYLPSLCNEIKILIVSYLSDKSKRILRSTSTEWFNMINYDEFTLRFTRPSMLPDIFSVFSRYKNQIGICFSNTIFLDKALTILAKLTNLTRLEVEKNSNKYHTERRNIWGKDLLCFTALRHLHSFEFASPANTPKDLYTLPRLTRILLYNRWSDESPNRMDLSTFIPSLENLTGLRSIYIASYSEIRLDDKTLSKLSNITKLGASCFFFPYSKLPNLVKLQLGSETQEFDDFSKCTKLTRLTIRPQNNECCYDYDFQQLELLTDLLDLNFMLPLSDEDFRFLTALTNLTRLCVTEYHTLTGQFLKFVKSSKLLSIDIPSPIKAKYLTHLTRVKSITLSTNTSADFNSLDDLPNLEMPNVTSLVTANYNAIWPLFPNLETLKVSEVVLEADRVALPSTLRKLSLTAADPRTLEHATNLTYLSLSGPTHDHCDLSPFTRLTDLQTLKFRGVSVDESNIAVLQRLTKLTKLKATAYQKFDMSKMSQFTNLQQLVADFKKQNNENNNNNTSGRSFVRLCTELALGMIVLAFIINKVV